MRISEKSWHYRYYNLLLTHLPFFDCDEIWITENPKTLCTYFWSFMFVTPLFLLHWVILGPLFVVSVVVLVIILSPFLLIAFLVDNNDTLKGKAKTIGVFIKSKKSGVCPLIQYYD